MTKHLVVVAGGTGSRMRSDVPKQLMALKGKPVIVHTLERFFAYDPGLRVIVVSHKDYLEKLEALFGTHFRGREIRLCAGGETRFHSVKNGLDEIQDANGLVAIHDAARPLVSVQTIRNCFETAQQKGNAIPVVPVSESLRRVENGASKAVSRGDYRIVQTPQCFRTALIKKAFAQPYHHSFTDDATVLERMGETINLVEGNTENIKITNPADLIIAEALIT